MAYYTTAHGVPELDATHQWAPSTAAAPMVMNDVGYEPRALPQIELDAIPGLRDSAELVDNRAGRTAGPGEIGYPPQVLGKTVVYEGRIVTQDRLELLEIQTEMTRGYVEGDDGVMTVTPWPPFGGPEPVIWTYSARVLTLVFDKAWTLLNDGFTYEWGFVLTLRMPRALFYTGGVGYR